MYGVHDDFSKPIEILTTINKSRELNDLRLDIHHTTIEKILNIFKPCFLSNS